MEIYVVTSLIWGYERAVARSYPHIREPTTATPNEQVLSKIECNVKYRYDAARDSHLL